MQDARRVAHGAAGPDNLDAQASLRSVQRLWARGHTAHPSGGLEAALKIAQSRESEAEPDGDHVRVGIFRYPISTERARWARTRQIIERVEPGSHEDPRFFEMLCRQAASVELFLAGDLHPEARGVSRELLARILIGTTGEPRSHGSTAKIADSAVILISAGMMDFLYQSSKAVVLAWKQLPGDQLRFSTNPADTDEELARDPYAADLLADSLMRWLYEGLPRTAYSKLPPPERTWPIQLILNGAERFVVAHEYGHVMFDLFPDADITAEVVSHASDRELQADAFAGIAVAETSSGLDLLPIDVALQGAVIAMKTHEILESALDIASVGERRPAVEGPTHPLFATRIALIEQLYVEATRDQPDSHEHIEGMLAPSVTLEQLWERAVPKLLARFRSGSRLHEMWRSN